MELTRLAQYLGVGYKRKRSWRMIARFLDQTIKRMRSPSTKMEKAVDTGPCEQRKTNGSIAP